MRRVFIFWLQILHNLWSCVFDYNLCDCQIVNLFEISHFIGLRYGLFIPRNSPKNDLSSLYSIISHLILLPPNLSNFVCVSLHRDSMESLLIVYSIRPKVKDQGTSNPQKFPLPWVFLSFFILSFDPFY